MASLKEIKVRIASIRSTQKIASAMKMVSSAKLHHTQALAEHTQLYAGKLSAILNALLASACEWDSPFVRQRDVKRVAIVVFSSSSGLCGTFNVNVWKELSACLIDYNNRNIAVSLYPIGKKIADELHKAGYATTDDFIHMGEKPSFEGAVSLATELMELYASGKADQVELLYHHFKSMASQILVKKIFLPVSIQALEEEGASGSVRADYILEPSAEDVQTLLLPKLLNLTVYTTMLDTATAEHAARMMAIRTPALTASASLSRFIWPGTISLYADTTPISGRSSSSGV